MDLSMPTIMASLVVGMVGFGVFRYGKKMSRMPHYVTGIVLMGMPYLVPGAAAMLATGGVILGGLWVATRYGH
jgi:hypothetical protein